MLSKNGYKAENIVDIILTTGSAFTLTAQDVVYLKGTGISDSVVQAMLVAISQVESHESDNATSNAGFLDVTLEDLLVLANNEVSNAVIISFIKSREKAFTLGANEIAELRKAGLSDITIQYLLLSESIAIDNPASGTYQQLFDNYSPVTMTEPYPEFVTSNHYSTEPFYAYPAYYYQPYVFFGPIGIQPPLPKHHHAGLPQRGEKFHVGLHHGADHKIAFDDRLPGQEHHSGFHLKEEHHVGIHDSGDDQHIGVHHLSPEHAVKHHSPNDSDPHQTSINKGPFSFTTHGLGAIRQRVLLRDAQRGLQRGLYAKETFRRGTGYGGIRSGGASHTTRIGGVGNRVYSIRSSSRVSVHSRSHDGAHSNHP